MTEIVWLEDHRRAPAQTSYCVVEPDDAYRVLSQLDDIAVVVIGPTVTEPVSLAQRVGAQTPSSELLILTHSDQFEAVQKSLNVTPLVTPHTRAVIADADLDELIADAVDSWKSRRRYRHMLSQVPSHLEGASPHTRRPSLQQYAATMWSSSPVAALAVIRKTFQIVSANRAATELFEHGELDLLGADLSAVLPDDEDQWSQLSKLSDPQIEELDRTVRHETSTGDTRYLEVRLLSVDSPGQDVILVFLWDITNRIRFEELQEQYLAAEQQLREQAEEASRVYEQVLASVSHDLRGPLTTLSVSTQLLKMLPADADDSQTADVLGAIERTTKYMTNLVNDLLDIARSESRDIPLELSEVTIAGIVEQAVEFNGGVITDERVTVDSSQVPSTLTIYADARRLVQVLQNLLSNAIKFGPSGQTITVAAGETDDGVRISVADQGPGIPAETRHHLFERFWQADDHDHRGLGLGLTIVHRIVDAHGGEITVEDRPSGGTVFHIDLPADRR